MSFIEHIFWEDPQGLDKGILLGDKILVADLNGHAPRVFIGYRGFAWG